MGGLRKHPRLKVELQGHTDSIGSAPYNLTLSRKRAESVRDYLVTRGIASDRVSAQGFGLNSPVADNATAEGRANNRRVEIVIGGVDGAPVAARSHS